LRYRRVSRIYGRGIVTMQSDHCETGVVVVINNTPLRDNTGKILGFKEGCGETGVISESYIHEDKLYYVIDMGNDLELHFTREHFDLVNPLEI
jgi:hypothetical protein